MFSKSHSLIVAYSCPPTTLSSVNRRAHRIVFFLSFLLAETSSAHNIWKQLSFHATSEDSPQSQPGNDDAPVPLLLPHGRVRSSSNQYPPTPIRAIIKRRWHIIHTIRRAQIKGVIFHAKTAAQNHSSSSSSNFKSSVNPKGPTFHSMYKHCSLPSCRL